jgi:hypothetical protein
MCGRGTGFNTVHSVIINSKFSNALFFRLVRRQDFLQWGMFRGRFIVETNEPIELDLRGFRLRANDGLNLERLTTAFMQVNRNGSLKV